MPTNKVRDGLTEIGIQAEWVSYFKEPLLDILQSRIPIPNPGQLYRNVRHILTRHADAELYDDPEDRNPENKFPVKVIPRDDFDIAFITDEEKAEDQRIGRETMREIEAMERKREIVGRFGGSHES